MSSNVTTFKTLGVEKIIPRDFGEYRKVISEALIFFLEGLSPSRTDAILSEQARLPIATTVEQRMAALARRCPTLHKMGQVLARDRRLPPSLRSLLQGLESMAPSVSGSELERTITAELGNLDDDQIAIEREPIAEASVAVVLPFGWRDGRAIRRGVFKVLKPNVIEHLEEELALLTRVGALLDDRCESYGIPALDYASLLEQVGERLSHEVRLNVEQQNLRDARKSYAGQNDVVIPGVLPFCTPRVTAMERIDGQLLSSNAALTIEESRDLARMLIEKLIAHPMWTEQPDALFHADPHAGNLMHTDDNKLGMLDWSLVARLNKSDRIYLSQMLLGAIMHDAGTIGRAIEALAIREVDHARLRKVIDHGLRGIRCGESLGLAWLTRLLDRAVTESLVCFGTDFLMFRKVLLTLDGMLADLDETDSADAMLAASFLSRLGREWGDRMLTPGFSRRLGTHLSTADLMLVGMSGSLTAARYWCGACHDFLKSLGDVPHRRR